MLAWLKGFPIGHYIIMAAIAVAVWMYGDLVLTKQALNSERDLREQWQHVAETQAQIQRRDTIIVRASDEADRAIQEAPNANTPVPPDMAAAWAVGIDSVRNAGTKSPDEHDMSGPNGDSSKRGDTNTGTADKVLKRSGNSVPTV